MGLSVEVLHGLSGIDRRTGKPITIAIDADCPECGWVERFYDTGSQLFGCRKCDYTSPERDA